MSLQTQLDLLSTEVASQIKADRTKVGGAATIDLSTLTTISKASLIAAINELDAEHGDLSTLTTTAKTTLVSAINEVAGAAVTSVNGASGVVVIDTDDVAEGSTNLYYTDVRADARVQNAKGSTGTPSTTEWAATQDVVDAIQTAIDNLINGAGAAYDTLQELAAEITSNDTDLATLLAAQAKRLRFDAAQMLTGAEQLQGQANLNVYSKAEIGSVTADYAAVFTAALV